MLQKVTFTFKLLKTPKIIFKNINYFSFSSSTTSIYDLSLFDLISYIKSKSNSFSSSQWDNVLFQLEAMSSQMSPSQILSIFKQLNEQKGNFSFSSCCRPFPKFLFLINSSINHQHSQSLKSTKYSTVKMNSNNHYDVTDSFTTTNVSFSNSSSITTNLLNSSKLCTTELDLKITKEILEHNSHPMNLNKKCLTDKLFTKYSIGPHWVSSHYQNTFFNCLINQCILTINTWSILNLYELANFLLQFYYIDDRIAEHLYMNSHILDLKSINLTFSQKINLWHTQAIFGIKPDESFINSIFNDFNNYIQFISIDEIIIILRCISLSICPQSFLPMTYEFNNKFNFSDNTSKHLFNIFEQLSNNLVSQKNLLNETHLANIFDIFTHLQYAPGHIFDPILSICIDNPLLNFLKNDCLSILRSMELLDIRFSKLSNKLLKYIESSINELSYSEIYCLAIYCKELNGHSSLFNKILQDNITVFKANNFPLDMFLINK